MTEFAIEECGAKGLAWTKIDNEGLVQGGIAKFIQSLIDKILLVLYLHVGLHL